MSDFQKSLTLVKLIDKGAFGSVFAVQHKIDKVTYAIKQIKIRAASDRERALREAEVHSQLNGPNIVPYKWSWTSYEGEKHEKKIKA